MNSLTGIFESEVPPIGAPSRAESAPLTEHGESVSGQDALTKIWHQWIGDIARSNDRITAAEKLSRQLASALPDHTVRLGWGARTLERLHDDRLGWLGADNSVRQRYDANWLASTLDPSASNDANKISSSVWDNGTLVIDLLAEYQPDDVPAASILTGGSKKNSANEFIPRCRLWIRPPHADDKDAIAFQHMMTPDVMRLLASVFLSRPANDRWGRMAAKFRTWWSRRGLIGIAFLLSVIVTCVPTQYSVDAKAIVTAMDGRMISSPIAATLQSVAVRPGDRVVAGQTLVQLDGRPLRIELESLNAQIDQSQKDEDISLASGQIAQSQLAGLRRKSLMRQADLISEKLKRLNVVSPIDGVVIQGDLKHALGSPLSIGQTLMEIAPEGDVEIELEVPESEIAFVEPGASVKLWFPAISRDTYESDVQSVWPAATIRDDVNVFVAITDLSNQDASLRVGMQGEAVVLGPTRPWIWKWIRTPVRRAGWMLGW